MTIENWENELMFLRHTDGVWSVGIGPFEWRAKAPEDQSAFFVPDFLLNEPKPWAVPKSFEQLSDRQFKSLWPTAEGVTLQREWREPEYEDFQKRLGDMHRIMQESELRKVVPVVFAEAQGGPDAHEKMGLLQKCIAAHHGVIAYGGWWSDQGIVGLTPEILFTISPGFVETMALAGTDSAEGASLLKDPKQMQEHRFVVEDIQMQLRELGTVKQTPVREWKVGLVKHLRTDMAVEAETGFEDLVERLHPTPALGGYPRKEAWTWLQKQPEARIRARFGAPFGVRTPDGKGFCVVAIRNLQWRGVHLLLGSGCGVLRQSEAESEWRELLLKRASVRRQLGIQ